MDSGIYTIENLIDKKLYIGQSRNYKERFRKHKERLVSDKHNNIYLQRAWNKYGEYNFRFELLEECEDRFLNTLEHYWCNILQTHDDRFGYNLKPTHPEGKVLCSIEVRKQINALNKGKKKSQDSIEKGNNTRQKIIEERGYWVSEEGKQRISKFHKGKTHWKGKSHTERTKKILSDSAKSRGNNLFLHSKVAASKRKLIGMQDKKHSNESKSRIKEARARQKNLNIIVLQYDIYDNFIKEWESLSEAANFYNIPYQSISSVCRGKTKTTCKKQFKWKFKNNN